MVDIIYRGSIEKAKIKATVKGYFERYFGRLTYYDEFFPTILRIK